ncbi:phenylacetate-CoA ligase [Flavobacteriaceae bacterium MAR_2010_188]|nr:phenylacetate-CoA ligase [Flavobacteriaceae bacterium MAR_2010_188]
MALNLFDLSLKLNNFPIGKARQQILDIQNKQPKEFEDYQKNAKKEIVEFHLKHNKFYRSLRENINAHDWSTVPILKKRDLQIPLKERLCDVFKLKDVYVNKTSGSAGDPFVFAKDKFCHAMTWAVIQNRFSWFGLDFNSSKQARFYGIPLELKGYYKERIKDSFSHRYRFSVFDLSDEAFDNCVEKFKNTAFKYINGYTSPVVQFAKYLEEREIVLNSICKTLECCIVTSEMLFEDDKVLLEQQFGVPIINEYGASELDLIAFENPEGEWRLNSETLFVEILDDHDQILEHGKEGRIVITSLYNQAHPFIRYDIGDVGIIDPKSTTQHPILQKLVGRTNDIAILPSGKKAAGLTFYYITKQIIEDDGNVKEFVIEQLTKETFKISYVSQEEIPVEKKKIIKAEMIKYLEEGLNIQFERLEVIKRSASGKLKQFTSKIHK